MRTACFHLTWILLALSCSSSYSEQSAGDPPAPPTSGRPGDSKEPPGSGYWEKLEMHPFVDAKGTVIARMPLPASWKVTGNAPRGEPTITGPHHIKVFDIPGGTFVYTGDPQMQQIYARSGAKLRPMPDVDQLVQQDLAAWCAAQGLEYLRHYEVPEVSKVDKWYNDQLYKAMPSEISVVAIGSEWKHTATGNPFFMLMHLTVSQGGNLQTWFYICNGLQAEKAHFERARKQFLFGLANAHYNPDPIMEYNKAEAQRVGRSWEEHNRRMAINQANFEASQRAFVNRSTALNETIMKNWRDRNAASDKAHEQFVDVITERTKVADPTTGKTYKVEGFSNQYWMNQDGEYFGTDNTYYDPNRDENMNRQNWQKLKPVE